MVEPPVNQGLRRVLPGFVGIGDLASTQGRKVNFLWPIKLFYLL